MKFTTATAATVALLAASVGAKKPSAAAMKAMMDNKAKFRQEQVSQGLINKARSSQVTTRCRNGKAGEYACKNVDMLGFLSHESMGSVVKEGNDIWGWTSSDGREFAIVGQVDGTAFAEVMSDGSLEYVGRLPTQAASSIWSDIKVIGNYAYVVTEAAGAGMQVFDLRKLAAVKPRQPGRWRPFEPVVFSTSSDLTAHYSGFGSAHNLVSSPETNTMYAVGTATSAGCAGGLWMIDVSDPSSPRSPGCVADDGYIHDAQCLIYKGPDAAYAGHEICFGYNVDALTIYDVTDKQNPYIISSTGYEGSAYTHQGWIVDPKMTVLLLDDELDEQARVGAGGSGRAATHIVDISSLSAPVFTGVYEAVTTAIDHNQYVSNGLVYQANYASGLRILDVSGVPADKTGGSIEETGFFDCYPEDDANPQAQFSGVWSIYPYFSSGTIVLNSIERGLFALKYTGPTPRN